ncbi:hypothetical protein MVEN_00491700 [Mycena venus]|uniref:F-box domain-containing protein n=1 Tax=Mycena venus TaxID=2733690 RepID=A0A8H7DBM8_9AGAR|nr:hypothetical protein MVEN_00491700 [Mycena venus]
MQPTITYLTLVPLEIWLACWSLCSRQQLRRLSLVCRLFRSLVLPLLFDHQTFNMRAIANGLNRANWIDRVHHLHRTAVRLDRLREDPYAALVRSLRVTFIGENPTKRVSGVQNIHLIDDLHDRVVAAFHKTLARYYYNLSSLHLAHITIDASLCKTLTSLLRLDDLNLSDCSILVSPGFLPLKQLSLWRCDFGEDQERLQLGSPETLRTLHPGVHLSRLISGFGPRCLNQLVSLWLSGLTVQQVDLFFRFLAQCPRLESLTICSRDNHITLPALHSESLPHLGHVAAPSMFHQVLTPGRPVHYADVHRNNGVADEEDYDRLMQVCLDIARSSVPVRILLLPAPRTEPNLAFLVGITALFPELQRFSFAVQPRISKAIEMDERCPDLNDEGAFDNLPGDDISDDEADERVSILDVKVHSRKDCDMKAQDTEIQPLKDSSTQLPEPFKWILDGRILFPPRIEFIAFGAGYNVKSPPLEAQYHGIAALIALYPLLTGVAFVSETSWTREGELWKSWRDKTVIRIT